MKQSCDFNSCLIKKFPDLEDTTEKQREGIKYHYTSAEAFLSIIKNKKIRFSDIRCMNDKSEGVYFVKRLIEFIEDHPGRYPNAVLAFERLLDPAKYDNKKIGNISYKIYGVQKNKISS